MMKGMNGIKKRNRQMKKKINIKIKIIKIKYKKSNFFLYEK